MFSHVCVGCFFFFKQKTAYEMRISDWSSDVCSSDLVSVPAGGTFGPGIYRVINYGGALTNNGLDLGVMPAGSTSAVQTSIAGQVNLVNTDGLLLNFWDGNAGPDRKSVV